ncbi:JNK1 MAPK8-associated membrane [Brachionus plicatilis]|uniref:JNK1 MAPK8-associated membrane n=1 Tax=Brachionus plicatilis TaxID=10195 RepID=A0A3M7R0W6_BRAPC|nr:JNK1 MAPK8-associated membrane [Brachionus plicatilis]
MNCLSQMEACPGKYCARTVLNESACVLTDCQRCERGFRPDQSLCVPCVHPAQLYDYMYLVFMFNISVVLHFFYVDKSFSLVKKKKNNLKDSKIAVVYALPLVECIMALITTFLVFPPYGSLKLNACELKELSDWYSVLFNPQIDYDNQLNCTQEIVYPFYSFVMVYFLLVVAYMLALRPIGKRLLFQNSIYSIFLNKSTFSALYFVPMLFLIHTMAAGVIYYTYPVITLVVFLISNNFHLSRSVNEELNKNSLIDSLKRMTNKRNLFIQLVHVYFYLFGIVALTRLRTWYDLFYLLCVPLPLAFFMMSYKHTNPKRLSTYWE